MPESTFDLSFRPLSYWLASDPSTIALATIPGEHARFRAAALRSGRDPGAYLDSLEPGDGPCIESSPASLEAGEFLPPARASEVEIARVAYASVLGDVVSIRARWANGTIRYAIVDDFVEDRDDLPYEFRPRSSSIPLTMKQLVGLIDAVVDPWADDRRGLVLGFVQEQFELGLEPDELVDFVQVTSPHYPQLGAWYRSELVKWRGKIASTQEAEAREERRLEVLARREALRRRRAEDRLIAASAPKAPWEIPAELTIQLASRVDLALLETWLRTLPGLADATLRREHRRSCYGVSKDPHLVFGWTEKGTGRRLEVGPHRTVRDAFSQLAADAAAVARCRAEHPW